MENLDNVILLVTCEFIDSVGEAPADAFLASWRNHAAAERAIRSAIAGRPAEFETASGLVFVRRKP